MMTTGTSDSSSNQNSSFATSVIQVTNIAPQATRDQMYTFFSFVGQVEDVRLYPSMRDASIAITSRTCFVRFADPASVTITLHLNNTVFIDRAIIITPVLGNKVPEENEGLVMAMQVQQQQQQGGIGGISGNGVLSGARGTNNEVRILAANPGLVSMHPSGKIATQDAALDEAGLPSYPLLPGTSPVSKVEEIRRTVTVAGLDSTVSAQQCMEFFAENAGEVKYFRYCTSDQDHIKYALIEFSERASVVSALNLNDRQLGTAVIKVIHATEAITKPQTKSNEAAAKEIEEAMSKVKEAQSLVSAAVDPLMGMLGGSAASAGVGIQGAGLSGPGRNSMTRSRSRSRRRSRSRDRDRKSHHRSDRRSRSRDRGSRKDRHRSRSRSRDRKRSSRHRSRSRDRKERRRSRSRDKKRSKRSRSRSKERDAKKEERIGTDNATENGRPMDSNIDKKDLDHELTNLSGTEEMGCENAKEMGAENSMVELEEGSKSASKRRSRTKSPSSKKRSRSREKGERRRRSKSRSKERSSRRKRSRSRERRRRSKSKDKGSSKKSSRHRSKSRDRDRSDRKRSSRSREKDREQKGSRSKDHRRDRTPESDARVTRDYDQEEAGFESSGDTKDQNHHNGKSSRDSRVSTLHEDTRGEAMGTEDMEISNSP